MGRKKGGTNRKWFSKEKLRIINRYLDGEANLRKIAELESISSGMLSIWLKRYKESGIEGLESKTGNEFGGLYRKKNPTELDILKYENFKLKMENEILKKGLDPERVMYYSKKRKD